MAIANFFVSGVWKNSTGVITDVFLHAVTNNEANFNTGRKTSEAVTIALLEKGGVIKTLIWNYSNAAWNKGAEIVVVTSNGKKYLRTKGDKTVRDNLDNLIDMTFAF